MAARSSKIAGNEGGGVSRTEIRMSNIHNGEGVTSGRLWTCEQGNRKIRYFLADVINGWPLNFNKLFWDFINFGKSRQSTAKSKGIVNSQRKTLIFNFTAKTLVLSMSSRKTSNEIAASWNLIGHLHENFMEKRSLQSGLEFYSFLFQ